ncbi:hypothetical protein Tco_1467926 [Tanacetum coccineum]
MDPPLSKPVAFSTSPLASSTSTRLVGKCTYLLLDPNKSSPPAHSPLTPCSPPQTPAPAPHSYCPRIKHASCRKEHRSQSPDATLMPSQPPAPKATKSSPPAAPLLRSDYSRRAEKRAGRRTSHLDLETGVGHRASGSLLHIYYDYSITLELWQYTTTAGEEEESTSVRVEGVRCTKQQQMVISVSTMSERGILGELVARRSGEVSVSELLESTLYGVLGWSESPRIGRNGRRGVISACFAESPAHKLLCCHTYARVECVGDDTRSSMASYLTTDIDLISTKNYNLSKLEAANVNERVIAIGSWRGVSRPSPRSIRVKYLVSPEHDLSGAELALEELIAAIMLMARIQPADGNAKTVPSYDAKAVSENKVYDPFLKVGLGYRNPERLKKVIAAQPKMYNGEMLHSVNLKIDSPDSEETLEDAEESRLKMRHKIVQINYGKLNALYETFVPQQEFYKNELLKDELKKSSSDSKDTQPNLLKRIKILESDFKRSQAQSIDFELKLQHQKEKMACDVSWKSKLSTFNNENVLLKSQVESAVQERENIKLEFQKLFNSIKATQTQSKRS